jgi:hypothetical protein
MLMGEAQWLIAMEVIDDMVIQWLTKSRYRDHTIMLDTA